MSVYSQDEDKETDGVTNESLEAGMKLDLNQLRTGTAFYTATGTLYRGVARQGAGRAGHRTAKYLCTDHHDNHRAPLCSEGK